MSDDRFKHDPETIEIGRRAIARIRRQLNPLGDHDAPSSETDHFATVESSPRIHERSVATDDEFSIDRVRAAMAAGAEREYLERRVTDLESEVQHLRAALAAVLQAASSGLAPRVDDGTEMPTSTHAAESPLA